MLQVLGVAIQFRLALGKCHASGFGCLSDDTLQQCLVALVAEVSHDDDHDAPPAVRLKRLQHLHCRSFGGDSTGISWSRAKESPWQGGHPVMTAGVTWMAAEAVAASSGAATGRRSARRSQTTPRRRPRPLRR